LAEHAEDQSELVIHSFVIRVWLEHPGHDSDDGLWRGQITHIPGGERKYFDDLTEIPAFIEFHLQPTGNLTNPPPVVP
jgi:hypothetical protein